MIRTTTFRQFQHHHIEQKEIVGPDAVRHWQHSCGLCGATVTGLSEEEALQELTDHRCEEAA